MKKQFLAALAVSLGLACTICTMPVSAQEVPAESFMELGLGDTDAGELSGNDISDNDLEMMTEASVINRDRTIFSAVDIRGGSSRTFDVTNGKKKIILFGGIPSCGYTTSTLQHLDSVFQYLDTSKVEVFCFDIKGNGTDTIRKYLSNYKISSDTFVNSRSVSDASNRLYNDARFAAIDDGKIDADDFGYTMPLVLYVDGSGNVLRTSVGPQSVNEILDNVIASGLKLQEKPRNGVQVSEITARYKHVKVQNFVKRIYNIALERGYDEAGLNDWVDQLEKGKATGANVGYGFFFSKEYTEKNLSNEAYVETLYMVMMDRLADDAGKKTWIDLLNNGLSREFVYKGFSESEEFTRICQEYGINRGSVKLTQGRDRNQGATRFVARLYRNVLGREYDVPGMNTWCNVICDKSKTVEYVSTTGFFHSKEFLEKNTSNEEYVKILYRTFLGREYDAPGLNNWVTALKNGKSRDQVLMGFSQSKEFKEIMAKYGL